MNAVDTNVPVYSSDHDEPVKQTKALDLLDQLVQQPVETILLWLVAGEYLSCLRKWQLRGKITFAEVDQYVHRTLAMFPLYTSSRSSLNISLNLSASYSLSHWDRMLLAACIEVGVNTLFTEDLDEGTTYDSVTIINPFA